MSRRTPHGQRKPRVPVRARAVQQGSRLVWLGLAAQPVGVGLVLVANGMFVEPYPPRPEWPILVEIALVAFAGLLPVVVQGARSGGFGSVAGRLLGWGFAQSGVGIATALLVRLVAGERWSDEAMFSAFTGLLAAAAWLVCMVLWLGARLVLTGLRMPFAEGRAGAVPALVLGGAGSMLLSSLVLGLAAGVLESAPDGRGAGRAFGTLLWSFVVDGPTGWVVAARVGGAGVLLGLLAALTGTVLAFVGAATGRAGRRGAVGRGRGGDQAR